MWAEIQYQEVKRTEVSWEVSFPKLTYDNTHPEKKKQKTKNKKTKKQKNKKNKRIEGASNER
jgi:hypothetical protein